jgi:hypothetical protein
MERTSGASIFRIAPLAIRPNVRHVTKQERRDVMTRSKTGWLFLVSACVLALAGVKPAVYADGGDTALIHACVNKSSGEIKIVGANASCKNNETALHWPATSPAPSGGGALLHARGNFSLSANVTTFAMFVEEGTETFVRVAVPRAGTLANLFVHPTGSPTSGAVVAVTVRINGADTLLAVSHASSDGTNTVSNTVDTVTVNQGDFIAVKFTESGGVVPGVVYRASFELK